MARTSRSTSVTGRDGYIVNQALLYAIAHIQSLPEEKQEFSNMCDMCAIVLSDLSAFTANQIRDVALHTGHTVNLWPLEDEFYTAAELGRRHDLQRRISRAFKCNKAFMVSCGEGVTDDPEILMMAAHLKSGGAIDATGGLFDLEPAA
ncbi:hypothetical protein GCM10007989_33700 [Devosia pacifica]|uniref:Uncharacterized protein n=1 Tax=Devosia pacifica TaxID=1335967 RepID=A0A918SDP1_9HYPH|nr:hypothetical protein [Devosia pacifica]GHA35037.1 hypothetical protein GCM10007989_33700 [Devosia pacifica]